MGVGLLSLSRRFLISEVIRVISFRNQDGFRRKLEEAESSLKGSHLMLVNGMDGSSPPFELLLVPSHEKGPSLNL
jgi:hypothetical protein